MSKLHFLRKVAAGSAVDAFLAQSSAGSVLVQVSHPEVTTDPELYGRFLDSTRTAATQHRHPALLSPEQTSCEPDGRFVLVTGPVSGRTGADHLRAHGPLSTDEAIRWGVRVCDALEFLHAHGVVHGHLAPHNLYLDGDPERPDVRLLDTALLLFRGTRSLPRGQVFVAAEYLSPERCAGRRATPACDLYGVGVLLFELLTGAPPFSGRTIAETRTLHLFSPLPELPAELGAWAPVLRACLAKKPHERLSSAAQLRDLLRQLQQSVTPPLAIALGSPEDVDVEVDFDGPPPLPRARELRPGDELGRYRLEKLLGEGGMGQVFSARHLTIDREVAIKVLRPELSRVESQVQRFMAEAQAVNRVKHPNIIEIVDLVREGERVYFVMELLRGTSLKALGKEGPIELTRVLRLMTQAADALSAAHGVGVIHRDVKPDNLLVVRDAEGRDQLKVLDFGVARIRGLSGPGQDAAYRTQVGQVVGTPLWMAPEQVLGHQVDPRADVYALSMVTFTLLTRRFPFEGADLSQIVMQRLVRDATPMPETTFLGEPVPAALRRLVQMGLSRDLAGRPATMEWFASALREIEQQLCAPAEAPAAARRSWWNRWRS